MTTLLLPAPVEDLRKDLDPIERRVTTEHTLSDLIREGSRVTPHTQGQFIGAHGACALGAAWISARARNYVPEV